MILLLLACGAPADSAAPVCEQDVRWDGFAHSFFVTYCTSCHSVNNTENRYGAPEAVNFDTESDVRKWQDRVRVRVLEQQDMPISGGVYENDLTLLDEYLRCTLGD